MQCFILYVYTVLNVLFGECRMLLLFLTNADQWAPLSVIASRLLQECEKHIACRPKQAVLAQINAVGKRVKHTKSAKENSFKTLSRKATSLLIFPVWYPGYGQIFYGFLEWILRNLKWIDFLPPLLLSQLFMLVHIALILCLWKDKFFEQLLNKQRRTFRNLKRKAQVTLAPQGTCKAL